MQDLTNFWRAWYGAGTATVLIPLLVFAVGRLSHSAENNSNTDNNSNCHWYQWICSVKEQRQASGSSVPWWWLGGQVSNNNGQPRPVLIFIYIWSLILFGAILYFGSAAITSGQDAAVIATLCVFANLCFVLMMLVQVAGEGLVATTSYGGGANLSQDGFYGQMGVLLYMTYFCWLLFSVVLALVIRRRAARKNVTKIDIHPSDYQIHSEPSVRSLRSEAVSVRQLSIRSEAV
jgi:preprotein translocase subunit SecG